MSVLWLVPITIVDFMSVVIKVFTMLVIISVLSKFIFLILSKV